MDNYYEILGVSPDARLADIKAAYRALANQWHPDRYTDASAEEQAESERMMRRLNAAVRVLTDTTQRQQYDERPEGSDRTTTDTTIKDEVDPEVAAQNRRQFEGLISTYQRQGLDRISAVNQAVTVVTALANNILRALSPTRQTSIHSQLEADLAALGVTYTEAEFELAVEALIQTQKLHTWEVEERYYDKLPDPPEPIHFTRDDWDWYTGRGAYAQ